LQALTKFECDRFEKRPDERKIATAHAAEQTIARLHSKLICHATPVELRGNNVRTAGEFRWTMQTAARPRLVPQPLTN